MSSKGEQKESKHGQDRKLSDDEAEKLVEWIRCRVDLPSASIASSSVRKIAWTPGQNRVIREFVESSKSLMLLAFCDNRSGRVMLHSNTRPQKDIPTGKFVYFVKLAPVTLDISSISQTVTFGFVSTTKLDTLFSSMNHVYMPITTGTKKWPENVRKDYVRSLHKFMASLTETLNHAKGKTVLYVPSDGDAADFLEGPRSTTIRKTIIQDLESTVIHWTRQIKEAVDVQENQMTTVDTGGPLDEIRFWQTRTIDLSGISKQLKRPDVQRILSALKDCKSSYIGPFEALSKRIHEASTVAKENLKFLEVLKKPCAELAAADPCKIPELLPNIMHLLRMIWSVSETYNTKELMMGLLRKVSNEIISRCCNVISLEQIFEGDVDASLEKLRDAIQCGVEWKRIYLSTKEAILATTSDPARRWAFDDANIFAQIDAFVQRCRDLVEVCEGQLQFATRSIALRKGRDPELALPVFAGVRGPETLASLITIEESFDAHLQRLKRVDYWILDAKEGRWHEDFNSFKTAVKDLETMLQNCINNAFEIVETVPLGVQYLEAFSALAKRDSIKRCVEKKTADVSDLFRRQLKKHRVDFEEARQNPPLRDTEPRYAGAGMWAEGILRKIKYDAECLQRAQFFARQQRSAQDAIRAYSELYKTLKDYISKQYQDWMADLQSLQQTQLQSLLNLPLLKLLDGVGGSSKSAAIDSRGDRHPEGLIEVNFDKSLLRIFKEVKYWERFEGDLQVVIPYVAQDVCQQRDQMRSARQHVLRVVREYNSILKKLSPDERLLFREHIQRLDRRISPGFNQLTWASKDVTEWFVTESLRHCSDLSGIIDEFHTKRRKIVERCEELARMTFVSIQKNRVYNATAFADAHRELHSRRRREVEVIQSSVVKILEAMYGYFQTDSSAVQTEWIHFVSKIDKAIESALFRAVTRSLQTLSKAVNGDKKKEPQVLFIVRLILTSSSSDAHNSCVTYKPTAEDMVSIARTVQSETIACIDLVPRLLSELAKRGSGISRSVLSSGEATSSLKSLVERPSFAKQIGESADVRKIYETICEGITAGTDRLDKSTAFWDKYEELHSVDKDAFVGRYSEKLRKVDTAQERLDMFESSIVAYRNSQREIQEESASYNVLFMKVDCGLLKSALIDHCSQWQSRFTALLNKLAREELAALHDLFESNAATLAKKPLDLDHLARSVQLQRSLTADLEVIESRFEPLRGQYQLLSKFDIQITEAEHLRLTSLSTEWESFQTMLEGADVALQKSKKNMRKDIESALVDFEAFMETLREESLSSLPYASADVTVEKAFERIARNEMKLKDAWARKKELKPGASIFDIDMPDDKHLRAIETDIDLMHKIWTVRKDWEANWAEWRYGKFASINAGTLETTAAQFNKRVTKLGRQIKKWKCWDAMRETISEFRATLPLILNLRNEAMRPRHWKQLMEEINKTFDPASDDFTLEKVFSLGLHNYGDFIGNLSDVANKELAIEIALKDIIKAWVGIEIEMGEYKDVYWKIRNTDDLFAQLEDNMMALSQMKASRFFNSFRESILYWESALAHMSEVVELALSVQRSWMYLESIFMTSEDIRAQLPAESVRFDRVNLLQKEIWTKMSTDPNAVRASQQPSVLEKLQTMESDLDKIQKKLDDYLETKRQMFPRFYFLSNDDLLEILGQQKDPSQVQKHIIKCFGGIKSLVLKKNPLTYKLEASAMRDPKGEVVEFNKPVLVDGPVELWLIEVESAMVSCLQKILKDTLKAYPKSKKSAKEKWIKQWPGMLLIIGGKIMWTSACTKGLAAVQKGNKKAIKRLKKKQVKYLAELSDFVRGNLTKVQRRKLVALITMEIHSRDVMERMIKANASAPTDFSWLSQLRYYFMESEGDDGFGRCRTKQTNTELEFGYEYQGNNGRLVVTPLTDRCVLTLTTALYLCRGGNPLGPAGTGKTETVKDLGKNLAKYVVVFNCSDGLDYKSVGRMFSGLVQSGGWGCFDEFNRIEIEVLSVIAGQILSIMTAISQRKKRFIFEGVEIRCRWSCGIFVTMNPGYAGRTELPDNLKSLMRPVAMMAPDLAQIAEVMLMAEGFRESRILAKKAVTLYSLMVQQLSKQSHYDYGLRSLKAVLGCCGALKRSDPSMSEDIIVLRALKDMNVPKFIRPDFELFLLLLGDLFPGLDLPNPEYGKLMDAIELSLTRNGLQLTPFIKSKTLQLYESKALRHCNMLVGHTLSGKSTVWKTLAEAQTLMKKEMKIEGSELVRTMVLNPKSVTMNELYGSYNVATMEWTDGVLSVIFRNCAQDERSDLKWIVLDGPVDTLWIESMNTVMDDNKTLTLINGDRISMSNQMSLVFEVQDLDVASPATVSRAGMVYLDVESLGWRPYVSTWLQRMFGKDVDLIKFYQGLFDKYVDPVLSFKRRNVSELVPIGDFNAVISLCNLLKTCITPENGLDRKANPDGYNSLAEKWFGYCLTWSLGASATETGRVKFDECVREIEAQYPPANTVYDFFVNPAENVFKHWSEKVPKTWRPAKGTEFFQIIVPTVDTLRNQCLLRYALKSKFPMLIVGNTGTGKTVMVKQILSTLPKSKCDGLELNFSAATTPALTQDIIEGSMEKRAKGKWGPPGGKQLVCFVDDLNMPQKDEFGSQGALEILRQWIDYGGWYDRAKQTWRHILDMQLIAAMGPPGGGRSEISERMQSRFNVVNFTFPEDKQVQRIFELILGVHLSEFGDDIKSLSGDLTRASIDLYKSVIGTFLPTPSKCHYLFNLRDIAKTVQGILMSDKNCFDTAESMLRLWVHESLRCYSDRFVDESDLSKFRDTISQKLQMIFDVKWDDLMDECNDPKKGPIFCRFLSESIGDSTVRPYEEVKKFDKLQGFLEEALEDYNVEPGLIPMDLVLFDDAVRYICKICRILSQPRGNAMLVGVGGSGRQSLSKLSAFVCEQKVFRIKVSKRYTSIEFHEDLKQLMKMAGIENKPTVFLFNDTQVKEESFLEDLNNILSVGTVPNLFLPEELNEINDAVQKEANQLGLFTPKEYYDFFVRRVRKNLHVILCMSPVGDSFRNRCRAFPSLVNCTTIIWYHSWPQDALRDVALKFLESARLEDDVTVSLAKSFAVVHESAIATSKEVVLKQKRHNYITPTHYLELVKGYSSLLLSKRGDIAKQSSKLEKGTDKLDESKADVERMSIELEKKQEFVSKKQKDCEELLVVIVSERRTANDQKKQVEADEARISKEAVECKAIADSADRDLSKALPALEKAMREVDKLDKGSISEVKAYNTPPDKVKLAMEGVMILFQQKTAWDVAKRFLGQSTFLTQIKSYKKDAVPQKVINKLRKYINNPEFDPEAVAKQSKAAATLCTWCHAIFIYAQTFKEVAPKRERLKKATQSLETKQLALKKAQDQLQAVLDKLADLQRQYDESVAEKNKLRDEAETLQTKLERADKLVSGLMRERERWLAQIEVLSVKSTTAIGDTLVASAYRSYAGPFDVQFRDKLRQVWMSTIVSNSIPLSKDVSFCKFLAKPTDISIWNVEGLPKDTFSTENGVIVTSCERWPLMVDPQEQANKWIRAHEGDKLKIVDQKMKDFLRVLENAIQFGAPYLLQDVGEDLDPALEPVLNKAIISRGTRRVIRLGEKEIDFSPDFKLYITTKLPNPTYTPEVSTKTTIINFAVKEKGLEDQLLGVVVHMEEPTLETQKSKLVAQVAASNKKLVDLEDEILLLLSEAKGSLLDDEELVSTLQNSKKTAESIAKQLKFSEETEKQIDSARNSYTPIATRAAVLYFVLNDLAKIDPMYQFSLSAYVTLFEKSIKLSKSKIRSDGDGGSAISKRIAEVNSYHMLAFYKYTCLGLFEKHKLLLSFLICSRVMQKEGKIPDAEFKFLLNGGVVLDRSDQRPNPCPEWLDAASWDNITELDKLPHFKGITSTFEQFPKDWRTWYLKSSPENETLPADWNSKCSELQRILIVRSIRPDRVVFAATKFVSTNIGQEFVEPPPFDLNEIFKSSDSKTPLVFVLSPGVDPTSNVRALAERTNGTRMDSVSLGQGQAPNAIKIIETGIATGSWAFLANCHLMTSWMPELEKIVEKFSARKLHPNFRLWLSSNPTPKFPISILQMGIKMTTEPPRGLKANLARLYILMPENRFEGIQKKSKFKKLLFSLCWFHSILLERRKFKSLGFCIPYDFNDSDFSICEDILALYIDEFDETPWDALRYLTAEANYGGRVTDDWDRRLVNVYISEFYNEKCLSVPKHRLSSLGDYYIIPDGNLESYRSYIRELPNLDKPAAFGQHPNADISSQIDDTNTLLRTILSLQTSEASGANAMTPEERVNKVAKDLKVNVPKVFDLMKLKETLRSRSDPKPLKTVLRQEMERYNRLLSFMHKTLDDIIKAIQGLVVMNNELEAVFNSLLIGEVPIAFGFCFPSLKRLGSWVRDLIARCRQMQSWQDEGMPTVFWLSGFTYPTGLLTALQQTSARANGISIDTLSWEFPVLSEDVDTIKQPPTEGAYMTGMYLEGARWDADRGCLADASPMELFSVMPVVHFKPVENKKRPKGMYICPLYIYPVRTGTRERHPFVTAVELRSGDADATFWIKRGTALLLSLAQ